MDQAEHSQAHAPPKTQSLRCKEYRERKKLKAEGVLQMTLLEKAKEELRGAATLDLEELLQKESFNDAFDAE